MTPALAAAIYLRLETLNLSHAIAFAHYYEDAASAEDFDAYLVALES